jgi:hypothetical protein
MKIMENKETLEEAAKRAVKSGLFKDETLFIAGAKWEAKRMYSEEEVRKILLFFLPLVEFKRN